MSRLDRAAVKGVVAIIILVAVGWFSLPSILDKIKQEPAVEEVVDNSELNRVEDLFREPEEVKMLCSTVPKYPDRPEYQISCWTEPETLGKWMFFEYVDGNAVFRSYSVIFTDQMTVFLTSDPGPFVHIQFHPIEGGPVLLDMPVEASHLRKGIQALPGRGNYAAVI